MLQVKKSVTLASQITQTTTILLCLVSLIKVLMAPNLQYIPWKISREDNISQYISAVDISITLSFTKDS